MVNFRDFVSQYLIIDYSPTHQALYCYINKYEDDKLFLITTPDFEKSGLLVEDTIRCKIEEDDREYFFEAKIDSMESTIEGLTLIISPSTEIDQFYNLRNEKRLHYKFLAFTAKNIIASVVNISNSGILISTTDDYQKTDIIILRLITSFPRVEYTFSGVVVRVIPRGNGKFDYGVKINKFENKDEASNYKEFVERVQQKLLPF